MKNFEAWLENFLMPFVTKFTNIPIVSAIKDGMIASMPFLVVGSIGIIIKSLPIPGWSDILATKFAGTTLSGALTVWSNVTFDLFTLLTIICIAYYYAAKLNVDELTASVLAVVGFAMVTPLTVVIDKTSIAAMPLQWLGSQGLFGGMIMVFISVKVYAFCINRNIVIKMPEGVPPNVIRAFAAMIPIFFVMVIGFVLRFGVILLGFESFHIMVQKLIAAPLNGFGGSIFGALIGVFLISLLWSFGIHGAAIVTGVMNPIWMSLQAENLTNFDAGLPVHNIVTHTFIDFGADEYTDGKPHPMIDPSNRIERFKQEAKDPEVGVILLDFVIGYGAHEDPVGVMVDVIKEAKDDAEKAGRHLEVIGYVLGTELDNQGLASQLEKLKSTGATYASSMQNASLLAREMVGKDE